LKFVSRFYLQVEMGRRRLILPADDVPVVSLPPEWAKLKIRAKPDEQAAAKPPLNSPLIGSRASGTEVK